MHFLGGVLDGVKNPDERRKEILSVAAKQFIEKGYYETSVSDIVKACGVAQGTFYYYFNTKEDIFNEVIRNLHTDRLNELRCETEKFPTAKEKIRYLCKTYIMFLNNFNIENKDMNNISVSFIKIISGVLAAVSATAKNILTDIFNEGIKNSEYTLDNAEFTAVACIGVLKEFALHKVIYNKMCFPEDEFEELIINYFEQILNVKLEG